MRKWKKDDYFLYTRHMLYVILYSNSKEVGRMEWFTGSERESLILLSWAFKHPFLYTLIRCFNPTLYIVIIIAGMKLMGAMNRRKKSETRYYSSGR
jgi:hypothetical protein